MSEKSDDDLLWRRLLWLRHGCHSGLLYGDDGEMQCSTCAIDFLRSTPQEIEAAWQPQGEVKLAAFLSGKEPTTA